MITNLEKKLKFIELVDEMKNIERTILLRNNSLENDAEHSFHLAIMVMTFIDDFPELNYEKCLKLALVHDLVEIYAWDTWVFNEILEKTKEKREQDALERLKKEFLKELPEIINFIEDYEKKLSTESKFVYSLDKIHPLIQVTLEWWKAWQEYKIDFDELKKNKYSKIYPEFWFDKILDFYFEKVEKWNMAYRKKLLNT